MYLGHSRRKINYTYSQLSVDVVEGGGAGGGADDDYLILP